MDSTDIPSGSRHHDVYRSFYTTDDRLVSHMLALLDPQDGHSCLEPAAGDGRFVDALLATQKDLHITAVELSPTAASQLLRRYASASAVRVLETDFLTLSSDLFQEIDLFDRVVANPPYGGWQDYAKRALLRARFPDLYVRETYGLFLARGLRRLTAGGRLVFIVPETFLYLHMQRRLRKLILEGFAIVSIDIFPSSFFPGVRFGYAKLCIIAIDNRKPSNDHRVEVRHATSLEDLGSPRAKVIDVSQAAVLARADYTFPLFGETEEARLIDTAAIRLGDLADCVTGIYTGDDRRFIRRSASNPRGRARYREVDPDMVVRSGSDSRLPLSGFTQSNAFLPLLKGGGCPYFKPELWFIDWSQEAVHHYRNDRKARFQNSAFYFRRGIGFPMVTSGRASAAVLYDDWIFDQSIVGVFPRQDVHFGFLMAFLNSSSCWGLLRQINPSANNSARYLKKLPVVLPKLDRLRWFDKTVSEYLARLADGGERVPALEQQLEEEVAESYKQAAKAL